MTVNIPLGRVKTCQYLQIFTTASKEEQTVAMKTAASRSRMTVECLVTGKFVGVINVGYLDGAAVKVLRSYADLKVLRSYGRIQSVGLPINVLSYLKYACSRNYVVICECYLFSTQDYIRV